MFCTYCGNKLDDDALFCQKCGKRVNEEAETTFCRYCGNQIEANALFCPKCGKRVNEQAAAQSATPTEQTAAPNNTNYAQTEPIAPNNAGNAQAAQENVAQSAPTQETEAEKRKKRRNEILTSVAMVFFIITLVLRCMMGSE